MENQKDKVNPVEKIEDFFNPYEVNINPDAVKESCELCQSLPCCPEHCCNWDTCECQDCEDCKPKVKEGSELVRPASAYKKVFNVKTWKNEYEPTQDPEFLIIASGEERVEQNKIKKKVLMSKKDQEKMEEELQLKTHIETVPNEVIYFGDETMIHNFEVNFQEEEELTYAGGIRGIRALRVQRDLINAQLQGTQPLPIDLVGNKFAAYEKIDKPKEQVSDEESKE